jgi:hypothetical protein
MTTPSTTTLLLAAACLAAGCGGGRSERDWTVEQAESIATVRGTPVRVRRCRGLGPEHDGRYGRFACVAGARAATDPYETVAVRYVLHPVGEYEGPESPRRLTNVPFTGGPGIP